MVIQKDSEAAKNLKLTRRVAEPEQAGDRNRRSGGSLVIDY